MPKDIIRPEAGTQTTRANNANLSNGSTSSRGNNYVPTQRTTTNGTAAVSHEAQLNQMRQTVDTLSQKREWKSSSSSQSQTVQLPQYDNSKSTPTASLNTNMGMLTYIDKLNQTDADAANNLYSGLKAQWGNYNSPYSRPYADITNKSKQILNELGIDTSNINDEWYNQYDGYMNYLPRSTYTNEFSTPTKRQLRDPNVMIGYAVYQFHLAEEQTAQAESEYAELQKEINYLAKDPRNFSNEEIKRRLNIAGNSKFKTLAKMDEGRVGKKPIELNRAINYNGEDDLDTLIWQARNGGPSGNYLRDMINAGYGNGNVWKEDPELAARQQSSPYAAGMVGLDDAGMYFGRYSFDLKWLQENEGLKDSNNPDDVKMYQKVHEGYLNAQAAKEDLAKLEKWLTSRLKNATDPQAVLDKIPWSKYPTLNKMVLSLGTDSLPGNGKYVSTTEAIDFSYDALKQRVEQACAENAEKGDLESFSTALEDRIKDPVTGEDIVASTTLDAIDSNPEGVEEQRQKDDAYIKEYAKDYDETHGPGSFQRDFGNLPGSGAVSGGGGAPEDAAERQAEYEAAYNAKYGPNAYEEDKAADIAAMENGTYTGPRHPPLTDEEKKLYAAQDAKLQDGADLVDEISTENEKQVFNTTGFSQFDTGKKMVDGYRNFVMGNNRAQRNFVRSLGEDEVKIHAKDTLDNYKTMYDYDTKKDEVSSWKLQYNNLSKELGEKVYAGKQIEDFRDPLIETAAGTFRLQLEFQMDDQGRGSYAPVGVEWMDDVDPDKARAMGISPNTLADTEQGRNLIAQYSYEANGIMSYQQNPVELTEEDEEALQQLRALELNIADGEAYLANNRLEAEAATKGFDEAQKHRESIIYLMRKEGLDTSKLEQEDQMLEYLTGFSDYERTVWSAYDSCETYHIAMLMGADPKQVLEAAAQANNENEAELKKALEAKAYIEQNGINVPQNYQTNLDRHIAKLQRNQKSYEYFSMRQNSDFEEIARKGREEEYANRPQRSGFGGFLRNPEMDWSFDEYYAHMDDPYDPEGTFGEYGLRNIAGGFTRNMTDNEKDTYYYLMGKGDREGAMDYIVSLANGANGVLQTRYTNALKEETSNMVKDGVGGFLGANALAVVASPLAALTSLGYIGYSMATGEEINPNNAMLFANVFRSTTREESARSIEEACGDNVVAKEVIQAFYEMVTTRLDSAANFTMFGGLASGIGNQMLSELISATPMGISAAMDAMADAKRNGASDGQAWGIGLVTMLMETGTEAVSIENIRDAFGKGGDPASTMKDMIKDWLTKGGISEMFGETLTDIVEDKTNEWIMGDDSDFADMVWQYRMQGIDDKDMAEAYARRDQMLKYARTALISYLTPGLDTFSFALGRADYYREKAHSEQLRGNRDATTWSEYKKAREARKAEAKNADTTLAEGNGPLNMGAVDEMLERREARDAAADLEQNGRANGEGAFDLSSLPPAPQAEAPAAEAPAPAPEQAEAPAPEFSAKDNADKAMTDYGLLEEAKSANADSQASTIASFLGDCNPDNDMVSNAAASRINEVFSDPINEMGDLMIGASAGGVDVSLVKQAITNAIVGGDRSLARQTMQSQEYQNANPEGKATMLADTVRSDSLDRDVGSATYKAVREWRIAQKEADMIKAGTLDNLHSAEQEADTARRNLDEAQTQLEERQGEVAAAQEALQAASYAVTEDPGNADNVNAVTQAVTNLENASKVEQEYEQRVQSLEAKQKQAEETANRLKESAMADLRRQATEAVAAEDQQAAEREAAETQARAEQEAAEAQAQAEQAAIEEDANNARVADADGFIELMRQENPGLTEEDEAAIRERFDAMAKDVPVDQAFLKFKEQVTNKFGVKIYIPQKAEEFAEFSGSNPTNGFFDPDNNRIVLNPKASKNDMMYFVLGHELTHIAEKADTYKQVANSLLRIRYGADADYDAAIANLKANGNKPTTKLEADLLVVKGTYDRFFGKDVGYEYALQEMVADNMGVLINPRDEAKRQDLINRLVAEEPSTARQILETIKRAIKQMLGMKGAWLDYSQQTVQMFEQALKEAQSGQVTDTVSDEDRGYTIQQSHWSTDPNRLTVRFDHAPDMDVNAALRRLGMIPYKDSRGDWGWRFGRGVMLTRQQIENAINNPDSVKRSLTIEDDQGNEITTELRGGTVALNTDVKRSLNSWTQKEQARVRKALIDSRRFTPQEVDEYLRNTNGLASMIAADKQRLDFQANPAQKFLKPNNDYYYTLDASTLCAKRLLYQGTFDYVQHALPDEVFTPEDLIDLVNIMNQMGYETPCGICYVESRRRWLDTYAQQFLDTLPEEGRPTLDQLTTSDGLEKLRNEDPDMYKAFVDAMNAKGSANPKVVQLRTEYNGDIGDLTEKDIQKVKDIGGLRIQSFSDFETPHLLDMVQAVLDMSSVGLTSQAYTKVPNFAWVFGDTGIKINLSLIGKGTGLDENGNLVFDNREGMNFDEAMRLRDRYSKNVGTILVGMNDDHIIAAMGDPRIDFIIPFHKSGWSQEELRKMPTLNGYSDYTATQNERLIVGERTNKVVTPKKDVGRKAVDNWIAKEGANHPGYQVTETSPGKFTISYKEGYVTESFQKHKERTGEDLANYEPVGAHKYWEFSQNGEWNARKYLQMCKEDGRIPKFSQFLVDNGDGSFSLPEGDDKRSTAIREGYWKTLIDFKMYDNQGVGAEQQAVTPNINMDQAERVLNEHKLGRQMPDKSDGTPGKFIPVESNNDVPVAIPAAEEFISLIKQRRAGKKPTGPNDTLKATPEINVMNLGKSQLGLDDAAQGNMGNATAASAAMAGGVRPELKRFNSTHVPFSLQQQNAMAIDAETGEEVRIKRSLPSLTPDQEKNYNYNQNQMEVGSTLKTLNGSSLKRYGKANNGPVGKEIGGQVYVHKQYAADVVPPDVLSKAEAALKKAFPEYEYNAIRWNEKTNEVAFQEAPNFDTQREPVVGHTIAVNANGEIVTKPVVDKKTGNVIDPYGKPSDYIWHHKWQWVRNDYTGFDVSDSWNWSKQWASELREPSNGNGIWNWDSQLDKYGLPHDEQSYPGRKRYSLPVVAPIKSSNESVWQPGHTEAWFRENGFPIYQDVPLDQQEINRDTTKKGHGTQIASTESTYRKLFDRMKKENPSGWQNMRVLDASSGLGLGTQAGREMGFNVTDIEPFPNSQYAPNYTDYTELLRQVQNGETEPFDYIVSNAVLNVIPQDTRDNLVDAMGKLLAPGGKLFVNVISKDYEGAKKSNPNLDESRSTRKGTARTMEGDYTANGNAAGRGHETFVWGSNSVQKVFSVPELIGYLKDALGDGYTIKKDNIGMTGVTVTKSKEPAVRYSLPSDAPYMAAVERGDMDAAAQDVESYAASKGYTDIAYHGTDYQHGFGFTEFDMDESQDTIFVAYDDALARTYTRTYADVREISTANRSLQDLSDDDFYEFAEKNIRSITDENGNNRKARVMADYEDGIFHLRVEPLDKSGIYTWEDWDMTRDELSTYLQDRYDKSNKEGVYKLYTRPGKQLVIDAEGRNWNDIPFDLYGGEAEQDPSVNYRKLIFNFTDTDWDEDFTYDKGVKFNGGGPTRLIAKWAKAHGYDSVRINNVYDNGGRNARARNSDDGFGDIGIFFKQDDVKSADTVTYDNQGNMIPLSERFNTRNPDIRYSLPSDSYLDQRIREYLQNGGVLSTRQQTPSPAPRQRQFGSQTAQQENTMTLHDQVRQYLREHSEYDPDTNRAQVDRALEWVQGHANGIDTDGYFGAVNDVTSPDFDYRSADGQARMLTVMCMASMKDDTSTELRLADAYNQQGTDLGRMLQARKLFQMMTPIGRQQVLQKQVDKINEEQKKKGKKPVKLSDEIIHEAGEAKTKEQFDQVRKKAAKELAEQLPPDWKEKLVAWRMLAMLGNVRTHVRNFLGNAIFMPVVGMKNKIGAVGEILTHQKTRTKTLGLADQQARAFAKADAKAMEGILRGDAKYNDGDQVQQERKIFGTGKGIVSRTAGKTLQRLSDFNSNMLEKEDWIFLQRHYRNALAGYMTANKLSAANMTGATLEAARTYAIEEAKKATYRDANAIATWLNKAQKEHPAAGFVVNAVLPFKKTPANILKRGVEYSPVGLLNAVIRGSKQVRTGQITANQLIDKFCAGLTGTGIMVMGAIFASLGAVHAGLDDDDDEFEKLQGEQEYSINPGRLLNRMFGVQIFGEDATFTIDWAAPVCMPFFTGAAIFDARSREEGKNLDIAHVLDSIMGITEPVFNLSMLDGVNSLLDVNQYGEGNAITQIGEKIVTNYATSYIPSALGQLARTVDTTRRKAYVESGADLSNFRYALEQSENKIPWLSKRNIPYRNVWGEADVSGRAEAAIENFISPGYGNRLKNDPVVTELERLYRETGNKNMIPKSAGKTVSVNGETIKLNAEQYDQYVVDRGTTARQVIEDLMESPLWQVCDDDTRADLVTDAWSYANQIARHRLDQRGKLDGWVISADTNGNATQAIIDRAVDKNKKDYISGHGQSMAEALYSGDYETYETSLQALEDAEATKSQVKGALRDYFKPLYQSAYVNGDQDTMSEIEDMLISSDGDFDMDDFDGWIYRNEDDEEEDASIYQWLNLENR